MPALRSRVSFLPRICSLCDRCERTASAVSATFRSSHHWDRIHIRQHHKRLEDNLAFESLVSEDRKSCFYSLLTTLMVHFVANAAIAPRPASQGAATVPATPMLAGISSRILPFSSLMMILVTFPSCSNSLTLSTRFSDETMISSFGAGWAGTAGAGAGCVGASVGGDVGMGTGAGVGVGAVYCGGATGFGVVS